MIPRLGDGNLVLDGVAGPDGTCLENDSPSRGRKPLTKLLFNILNEKRLENDSPSRGRKLNTSVQLMCHLITV